MHEIPTLTVTPSSWLESTNARAWIRWQMRAPRIEKPPGLRKNRVCLRNGVIFRHLDGSRRPRLARAVREEPSASGGTIACHEVAMGGLVCGLGLVRYR